MNKDSKILLVLLSAVLITSGCVDNQDSETNVSPISVNDFSATPNPAPGDQSVNIQMELENTGDQDADGVYARLFGPTFASEEGQSRTWRSSDRGAVSSDYRTMDFGALSAASETSPAVPGRDTVTFTSPNLEEGRIVPYTFNAEIQYQYRTTGSTTLQIMSNERYQDTGASQTQPEVETSSGPMQFSVQGTTPHVFYEEGAADDELCVTITNQGSGQPFLATTDQGAEETDSGYDIPDNAEGQVELRIEDVGNVKFESQETSSDTIVVDIIGNEGYHCFDMSLEGLGEITDVDQTTDIPIELVYGYEEETSTSVTVEGRRN